MATIRSHLTSGLEHARKHKYAEAVGEFDLLLSVDPINGNGLYYRGCAKLHLGQYELAIADFDSAISLSDLSPEHNLYASYKRGYAYHKLGQFDRALDDYKRFLRQCKEQHKNDLIHKGLFGVGCTYAARNQHDQAVCYFENAINISNGSDCLEDKQKLYYLHRGRAFACNTKYEEALADLKFVIEHSNDPFVKGCAYNELAKHREAVEEFNRWITSSSDVGNSLPLSIPVLKDYVWFRRGLSNASLNYHTEALADYQNILDRSPPSLIADRVYFRKGMSSMTLNDPHDALVNFNKSTSINAHQSDVFYARGMLQFDLGRHDAAVHDHRRAIELGVLPSSLPSIYKTFFHTHYHGDDTNPRYSYQNKLRKAEKALKKSKGDLPNEIENNRRVAECKQQCAPYSLDPVAAHLSARNNINKALELSSEPTIFDTITLGINHLGEAQMLCDKYPDGVSNECIVEQFVNSTMNGIWYMSQVFEHCESEQNWKESVDALQELLLRSSMDRNNNFNNFRYQTVKIIINKAEMIKKTLTKFNDSPEQQEFYKLLVIRLCNLFDATRSATTGIFQHTLTGTFTKVSWSAKIVGFLFKHVPIVGEYGATLASYVETGLKKIDEERIQKVLNLVGSLERAEKLHEAADKIAEKLTIMYKWQIEKFPITGKKPDVTSQPTSDKPCCCVTCCSRCIGCFTRSKNRLLNEREASIMQTIVQYAMGRVLDGLTKLETDKINDIDDLQNLFMTTDKLKPKEFVTDNDQWNTYEFFRRPGIKFESGDTRPDKQKNDDKFGYRGASWEEEESFKRDLKKFDEPKSKKEKVENDTIS